MKEQLVSFETAKLASKKGFKQECFYSYSTEDDDITIESGEKHKIQLCSSFEYNGNFMFTEEDIQSAIDNGYSDTYFAPFKSQLQKWLREEYNIHIEIYTFTEYKSPRYAHCVYNYVEPPTMFNNIPTNLSKQFDKYEEALEKGLQKALKLIK